MVSSSLRRISAGIAGCIIALSLASPAFADVTASPATTTTTTRTPQTPGTGVRNAEEYLKDITPENAPKTPLGFDATRIQSQTGAVSLVQEVISTITGFLAAIAGTFAVFMLMKHAFHLITSDGDSKKAGEARTGILWSLLGLLGIMFSYLIIYTIVDTLFRIGNGSGL